MHSPQALRIYLHEREEGRALTLVNLELVRLLNEPGLVTRVLSDFQHYVDIGRDCLDRLRAQRSDVITKEVGRGGRIVLRYADGDMRGAVQSASLFVPRSSFLPCSSSSFLPTLSSSLLLSLYPCNLPFQSYA